MWSNACKTLLKLQQCGNAHGGTICNKKLRRILTLFSVKNIVLTLFTYSSVKNSIFKKKKRIKKKCCQFSSSNKFNLEVAKRKWQKCSTTVVKPGLQKPDFELL